MECECVRCPECNGTGDIWVSFTGEYLGRYRLDDLDELETCPVCDGRGLYYLCDKCREEEADAHEALYESY